MDKLKRVLNGNDDSPNDENRGIMGDVCGTFLSVAKILILLYVFGEHSSLPLKEIQTRNHPAKSNSIRGFGFHGHSEMVF